jgi:hypothetical protein
VCCVYNIQYICDIVCALRWRGCRKQKGKHTTQKDVVCSFFSCTVVCEAAAFYRWHNYLSPFEISRECRSLCPCSFTVFCREFNNQLLVLLILLILQRSRGEEDCLSQHTKCVNFSREINILILFLKIFYFQNNFIFD